MKLSNGFAATLAAVGMGVSAAVAQTAVVPTAAPQTAAPQMPALTPTAPETPPVEAPAAKTVSIITRPAAPRTLSADQPAALDLSLIDVPGAAPDLVRDVTAKAFARMVEVDGKRIGQVLLVGVARGGRVEALPPEDFSAQFPMAAPRLGGEDITIDGDGAEVLAALRRLQEDAARPEQADAADTVATPPAEPRSVGSDGGSNGQASGYEPPDPVKAAEKRTPVETVSQTTDGCDLVVDLAREQVREQSRLVRTVDGAVADEGTCGDDGAFFPLKKSYSVCRDAVDPEARTATAQFTYFYVDSGGARHEVTDCAPDPEKAFPIVEENSGCSVFLDYANEQAVPRAALVYLNDSNVRTQVRGCEASSVKQPVPLTRTTAPCTIRHDFPAGRSIQQSVFTYDLDGTRYQAGDCMDGETVYPHEKVYSDAAGQPVCKTIIDLKTKKATRQSRLRITVDGVGRYITDCRPDRDSVSVTETTEGCSDPGLWRHDLTAGVSYGQSRFYYPADGKRVYTGGCRANGATYAHKVETVGWQNFNATKDALPLTTVYIETPGGRYDVATGVVLPGAIRVAYEYQGKTTVANGRTEYSGCSALRQTDVIETYRRPDGTGYTAKVADGKAVEENACKTVQTPVWSYTGHHGARKSGTGACTRWDENNHGMTICVSQVYYCHETFEYAGTRVLEREDRTRITQHSAAKRTVKLVGETRERPGYLSIADLRCPSPPARWTGSEQIQWNQAEGW